MHFMKNPSLKQQMDMKLMETMKEIEMKKVDLTKPLLSQEICLNCVRKMEEEKLATMAQLMPRVRAGQLQ
jgi:hypothetical protein